MNKALGVLSVLILSLVYCSGAFGLGFYFPDHDSKSIGVAGAIVATADQPSAAYHNPAGLTQNDGYKLHFTSSIAMFTWKFRQAGQPVWLKMKDDFVVIPNLFASADFGLDKWGFGFGIHAPFGMRVNWGDYPQSRYYQIYVYFQPIFYTLSAGYKLTDNIRVGAGLHFVDSYLKDERMMMIKDPIELDAHVTLEGTAENFGGTFGIMYSPIEQLNIGLVYHTRIDVGIDGTAYATTPYFPDQTMEYGADVVIPLPQVIKFGIRVAPNGKYHIEGDVFWVDWRCFDKNVVEVDSTGQIIPMEDFIIERNWQVSIASRIGIQYNLKPNLHLRGGYIYDSTAIPRKYITLAPPDDNKHQFNCGIGWDIGDLTIEAAYSVFLPKDGLVLNSPMEPPINGEHYVFFNSVSLSLLYRI